MARHRESIWWPQAIIQNKEISISQEMHMDNKEHIPHLFSGWSSKKNCIIGLIGIIGSIAILTYWLNHINWKDCLNIVTSFSLPFILYSIALSFLALSCIALRWSYYLKALGIKLKFKESFLLCLSAAPINTISPSKTGDLIKLYFIREKESWSTLLASQLVERIFDLFFLALTGCIGAFWLGNTHYMLISFFVIIVVLAPIVLIMSFNTERKNFIFQKLKEIKLGFSALKKMNVLFVQLLLTSLQWAISIFQVWLFYLEVGSGISILHVAALLPLAILIGLLPISFGGVGTRDTALILLFTPFATQVQSFTVGLLFVFFRYWIIAFAGLPILYNHINRKKQKSSNC
ncbi:MAG: flippase-like domain-containing protein [Planctomycetes bacterium]|nr:flippase-like domain-containing protein [Planctomycetota bacterium]